MKISFSYKPLVAALMLTVSTTYSYADETTDTLKYHRSSIYTILLEHPGYKFGEEIKTEFLNIPLPDKYNNHNLSVRSFMGSRDDDERELIESFLTRGDVAKRMVSKWFNREKESGAFDMSLITDRGYYDANILDVKLADLSARGRAMLADAGEELIQNTFIVVNDIRYIDKEARAQKVKLFLELASIAADAAGSISSGGNSDEYNTGKAIADLADMGASISDMIAGFRVNITSYLYQLEWDDEKELSFYKDYYYDQSNIDPAKKAACQPTQISGSGPQAVWIDHNYQRKKKIPEDQQFQTVPKGIQTCQNAKSYSNPLSPFCFPSQQRVSMAQDRAGHDQSKSHLLGSQAVSSQMDRKKPFQKITDKDQDSPERSCIKKNIRSPRISVLTNPADIQSAENFGDQSSEHNPPCQIGQEKIEYIL